ncbi:Adaptin ear-binding coat-associated protein 2, partial [Ophiophagus hannah]
MEVELLAALPSGLVASHQVTSLGGEGPLGGSAAIWSCVCECFGRRAFIGIGFVDRGDAFDFNVALQDHFKWVKQQDELAKEAQNPTQGPKLDLGFKEGQTIKLSIANMKKKDGSSGSRPRTADSTGLPLLPPPPGGKTPFFPTHGEQLPLPLLETSADAVQTGLCGSSKGQMLPGLGPHSRQVLQEKLLQTSGEISPKLLGQALSLSRTRVGSSSEAEGKTQRPRRGTPFGGQRPGDGPCPVGSPIDPCLDGFDFGFGPCGKAGEGLPANRLALSSTSTWDFVCVCVCVGDCSGSNASLLLVKRRSRLLFCLSSFPRGAMYFGGGGGGRTAVPRTTNNVGLGSEPKGLGSGPAAAFGGTLLGASFFSSRDSTRGVVVFPALRVPNKNLSC